jgi:hypothetical protein
VQSPLLITIFLLKQSIMKLTVTGLIALCVFTAALQAQTKKDLVVTKRAPVAAIPKKPLALKRFDEADAKSSDGKRYKATDLIKTLSGKSITVKEYLERVNKIEAEMNQKGFTLRDFKPAPANLLYKPVLLDESRINTINIDINRNVKPLLNLQTNSAKIFIHKSAAGSAQRVSLITDKNAALFQKLKDALKGKIPQPETIEKKYSIDSLLKPLADKINASMDNDDAEFQLTAAELVVRSHAAPPAGLGTSGNTDLFSTTASEYKVAVKFGATMKLSIGLPINITLPVATMNGEFIAPSNTAQKLSRKVIVNLMGRSLFNKTAQVTTNTLDEEFQEELDISEITNSTMNIGSFTDCVPSIGFNTDISNQGAIGCKYKADMTRTNVDAYIGPTYSMRLRVAASFGMEDVLEGGIEGIVTLLKGSLGFGGNAGLDYEDNKWKLLNTAYVESSLEVLQGQVNFFVRYPDMLNWSCFGPCIKTERFPIYKTPVAFKLQGTLLQKDNGTTLNW